VDQEVRERAVVVHDDDVDRRLRPRCGLRGITDTIDSQDPHIGLIQFKVGTGGEAVQYVGEWDLPLNRLVYKAFDAYMSRR